MKSAILLLSLVTTALCVKLVPIVRMVGKDGISTYSLNDQETLDLTKKGFKKFADAGYLVSVEDYEKLKEKCPHLQPIIRYATNFGGTTMYRLATTYHLNSRSVIGFAVTSPNCGATTAVREFSSKTKPDHIYVLATLKDKFPPYSQYVMSGTPFHVWMNNYNGDFAAKP